MENELNFNAVKLSPFEKEALRKKIVRTMQKHNNTKQVAEICECSVRHVQATWKRYKEEGIAGIKSTKTGRPSNTGKLNKEQQSAIRRLIVDKCPNQLKLKGYLWDRQQVSALIYRIFNVKMSVQAVGNYLRKWGMSPQRPRKQNYKQQPKEVQQWLDNTYPQIKARANEENAEIHWGDETGCQNECNYVKGYAPIGQTPSMPVSTDKHRINMISSVTNQGKLRFMSYEGTFNAEVFLKFIKRLVNESERKVYLIVDNLKSHHAKIVTEWVGKHQERIELFFLPPYCPEYNPDEYLNGNLKRELEKKGIAMSKKQMVSNARSVLKSFQCDRKHVARLFQADKVKYASSNA